MPRKACLPSAIPVSVAIRPHLKSGSYTVNWNDVSGAARYLAQESINSGGWHDDYEGSVSQYSVAHTNGTFAYRVRACKTFACSAWSGTVTTVVYVGGGSCDPWLTAEGEDTQVADTTATTEAEGETGPTAGKDTDASQQIGPC